MKIYSEKDLNDWKWFLWFQFARIVLHVRLQLLQTTGESISWPCGMALSGWSLGRSYGDMLDSGGLTLQTLDPAWSAQTVWSCICTRQTPPCKSSQSNVPKTTNNAHLYTSIGLGLNVIQLLTYKNNAFWKIKKKIGDFDLRLAVDIKCPIHVRIHIHRLTWISMNIFISIDAYPVYK